MVQQIPVDPSARADEARHGGVRAVLPDLAYQRLAIVNVAYFGTADAGEGGWVLIDTGIGGSQGSIVSGAESRFGLRKRPAAIVLTHGHFDHAGSARALLERWDVPVFAHPLEFPYLDGSASYPPPDPKVGGGIMSLTSGLFPRGPVDLRRWLRPLPEDGSVPHMPGWRWIHTPGHTPGHVSLWRAGDRALIAGDAFITTAQESAYAVFTQRPEMHGPPRYYTQDWEASWSSVQRLASLEPEIAITGHGHAMRGPELRRALHALASEFEAVAIPRTGRYVDHPARPDSGNAYPPPSP